ncbi:MAG TPA: Holliday junction branch migration DNA helicase RuvB [Gemmatimonadales bacterium]|jgi:holliday junction DNA helicase RuvB|nr:Holliday junction branch migration DNA helicase RuvB [Gemmatimonadales bacterium]
MAQRLEVTTPDALPDETGAEAALRPSRLDEFVGQEQVKASLQIAMDAARGRGEALDHTLFFGPPGLGKTTLAMLMAREMGVQLRTSSGPVLEKAGDLVGLLTTLGPGDILFIDEIHRMRPALEEFLYSAMEDFRVDVRIADGPNAQTIPMTLERFTLVGATTRFGLLTPPMRARFGMVERLNFYPPEDLERIVTRSAALLQIPTDAEGGLEIAKRSRGTPRVANRLLRRVRDYAQVRAAGHITGPVARDALSRLNVDEFGLDDMDARILKTLIEKFGGGPCGLNTLAVAVGEDSGTLEEVYEPYLIQQGFLERTPRGRCATAIAYRRFGITPPPGQATIFDG